MGNKAIHKFKSGDLFDARYTLDKLIGVGGFADVWKATDNSTHSIIALKIYTNLDNDGIDDLSQEYTQMQNLNHTNILKADHFDKEGNIPYLVMKYCSGGSLDKKIGKLSEQEIFAVMKNIVSGLVYLHQNKIVHQDIKPANILIDSQEGNTNYVLSDFGISSKTKTRLSHSVNLKNQGTSMTEAYAPPEKFSSKKEERRPDRKGDIFSFGISMYEIITGGLPFDELSTGRQLLYGDVEIDFSEIKNEEIRKIIALCMQTDKESRPTAEQLYQILMSGKIPEKEAKVVGHGRNTVRQKDVKTKWTKHLMFFISLITLGVISFFLFSKFNPHVIVEDNKYVQKVDTFTINGIHLEMVKIPGGTFTMGCADSTDIFSDSNEKPAKKRQVSDFYMSKYEVTQKLWSIIMKNNPSTIINDNYPVNNISWDDCQLFIQKINVITGRNFRLPTETEWEYTAKMKINSDGSISSLENKYAGTSGYVDEYAWFKSNSNGQIHQVGQKKPNDLGLYDMSGNVIEWCQDIYTNYGTGNPEIDKNERVLRGGYFGGNAASIRCTSRGSCNYKMAMAPFGLRLCLQ